VVITFGVTIKDIPQFVPIPADGFSFEGIPRWYYRHALRIAIIRHAAEQFQKENFPLAMMNLGDISDGKNQELYKIFNSNTKAQQGWSM
jgi:hypothetical protein